MEKSERYLYKEVVELEDGRKLTVISSETSPRQSVEETSATELSDHELSVIGFQRPLTNNWSD